MILSPGQTLMRRRCGPQVRGIDSCPIQYPHPSPLPEGEGAGEVCGLTTVLRSRAEIRARVFEAAMSDVKLSTPKGMRLHIGILGRRNVGKSSLLNAIVRQHVSLVSEVAGTTTDPVEKPMELLPLGPVLFIDTAGIDDEGALGELRVKRTTEVFDRIDLGLIVAAGEWGRFEDALVREMQARQVPLVVAFNKVDVAPAS